MSNASKQAQEDFVFRLDQQWQLQQQKTFTAWVNSHLKKVGLQVTSLEEDFKDGVRLMKLLESLSGEEVGKVEKGKTRIPCIQNINKALDFIKSKGVRLAGIAAEEINDGNLKMVLGMIWTIILRFQIQDISVEEMTAKEGLLLWCQRKTFGYENVDVKNFHVSFQDGLAFCALIHRHRPDLIDFQNLSKDEPLKNLNLAFQVAESKLDISKLLDAEDMISTAKPDERSVMTYVASYYHYFSQFAKTETAARRVAKVIEFSRETDEMKVEYETLATNLLEWVRKTEKDFSKHEKFQRLEEVQKQQILFREYKKIQKPLKVEEKAKLEGFYTSLQTKLRMNGRPSFVPSCGKFLEDLQVEWNRLEGTETKRQEFIRTELMRLEKLEMISARLMSKMKIQSEWISGKEAFLTSKNFGENIAENLALKKQHFAFESTLNSVQEARLGLIQQLSEELRKEDYYNVEWMEAEVTGLKQKWDFLMKLSNQYKEGLLCKEKKLHEIDELSLDFAKQVSAFSFWMETTGEDLQEEIQVRSLQEAKELRKHFQEDFLAGEFSERKNLLPNLCKTADDLTKFGVVKNPYTTITKSTLMEGWKQFSHVVENRKKSLDESVQVQERKEAIKISFAQLANQFASWLDSAKSRISEAESVDISSQLERLKSLQPEIAVHSADYDLICEKSIEVEDAMIFQNKHTVYTAESLGVQYRQLKEQITKLVKELEDAIVSREMSGTISNEILQEYRSSYNHFDQNKKGYLTHLEFRACLMSLGYDLAPFQTNQASNDFAFDEILLKVDPHQCEKISFESFVDFMTQEVADTDSPDQIKSSFQIMAGDSVYIQEAVLRRDLSPQDAQYCLDHMEVSASGLNYSQFTDQLYCRQ
eukprot:Sdes_comp9192_c0_seq1m664